MTDPRDDEIEALRRRVAELEAENEDLKCFAEILEATPDLVSTADANRELVYLNPAGRRIFGYAEHESTAGFRIAERHPRWALEVLRSQGTPAAIRDGVWLGETAILDLQGREIPVSQAVIAHKRPDGELAFLSTIMRDITERKRNEARLHHLLSASPIGIYTRRPDGDRAITFASESVTRILGYTPAELVEDRGLFDRLVHREDAALAAADLPPRDAQGEDSREYRVHHRDGSIRWLRDDRRLLRDDGGKPIEIVGSWQDITARKQAELTVREQAHALVELSTPLIPISDKILVMPLIGVIDTMRMHQIMETLLAGIAKARAEVAILDITGVGVVDTAVANALLQAARAVELLGAKVVLTGIRPEVAQTLVMLGADLGRIATAGSLQAGIAYASR